MQTTIINETEKCYQARLTRTMRETAEIIGVNYLTVHRLAQRGLLKPVPGLRHKLFTMAEINRYLGN